MSEERGRGKERAIETVQFQISDFDENEGERKEIEGFGREWKRK